MTPEQLDALEGLRYLVRTRKEQLSEIENSIRKGVRKARRLHIGWRQIAEALGMAHSNAYDLYHE